MKLLIISCMILFVCILPGIYYSFFKSKTVVQQSEDTQIPLFSWTSIPASFFELLGFGRMYRILMPVKYQKMQMSLVYSGLKISAERVFCTQIALFVIFVLVSGGITAALVTEDNKMIIPIVMFVAALLGYSLPGVKIGNMEQKRQEEILRALPFSIDLIGSAMRGGLDFSAAIRYYVFLGIKGPLVDEYRQMLREMELGVIRSTALMNMAERIRLKEFTTFADSVVLGMEFGASLSETMEIQGEEMRKLRFSLAECKAQRAPSLMLFPMALFIMPAVFIIILVPVFLKLKGVGL